MKKSHVLTAATVGSVMLAGSAMADFSGSYAPGNWTFNDAAFGAGALNATSMVLTSGDASFSGNTSYTMNFSAAVTRTEIAAAISELPDAEIERIWRLNNK